LETYGEKATVDVSIVHVVTCISIAQKYVSISIKLANYAAFEITRGSIMREQMYVSSKHRVTLHM
jgi:hypothetical protein